MNALPSLRPWHRSPLSLAIAATLVCAAALPVQAQERRDTGAATPEPSGRLEEIIVTANKREENIREIAASISVIGEGQLENLAANSLADYADLTPGFHVQDSGSPGLVSISLRGVAPLSSSATVATYIDEVPVGSSGIYQAANTLTLDLLPYDISRVEVLRGPQGTLYGAGAVGGLLKYVTRPPDLEEGEIRAGVGLSSMPDGGTEWNARIGGSMPLQNDRLGVRLSFARNGNPGFTDNAVDGREDVNEGEQIGGRAALQWDGDTLDVDAGVLHQRIRSDERANVALDPDTYKPLFGDLTGQFWQSQPFEKDLTLATLSLNWDLGWGNFVSATGWSEAETLNQIDSTVEFGEVANLMLGLPEAGSSFLRYEFDLDKVTQEFRLTSKGGGQFEWMVGAFYTKEDAVQSQYVWLGQLDGSPLPAPYDDMFSTLARLNLYSDYEEIALFVNGSWQVSERFKIGAGLRQAFNDQTFRQEVTDGILIALGETPGESDEDVFTWSLSPQFTLADDVMLYARVATGYQAGGPNVAVPGMPPSVDSSMLDSYELGIKSQFADDRVQLDVSVFRIEWDDIQVAASFEGIGGLVNGGEATSEGIELSSHFRPTDSLRFDFNAAYTEAELKSDFQASVIPQPGFDVVLNSGLAGDRMPYVPELSWSAAGEYAFDAGAEIDGQVGARFRWVDDRVNGTTERQRVTASGDPSTVLQEEVTDPLELDSYYALDLYAVLSRGALGVRVYANNLTDERGYSSMGLIESQVTGAASHIAAVPIQPRTFGLELDYRF